jgi:hypothetical protein
VQTHAPLAHTCPAAHEEHAAPLVPHDDVDSEPYASHTPADVQQPIGHEAALQTHAPVVVLHACPVGHAAQVAPLLPHEVFDSLVSASHVPPAPQQPAHELPPHPHAPPEHESPEPHALQATPPVPHCELD